ncbi:hypothetical protein [Candidatus Methanomassiliicoccus intestinalis]|jgi:hypothetical protein|uniref:hypothetical protein n=1 Tax=Candidatus Methanomassiliicoccus intestinalis TaxID=1406512 RepID=UPI0037DC3984
MEEDMKVYRLKYYPIQSFGIWKGDEGWKNNNIIHFENFTDYCAIIINGEGHLEILSLFEIPDDKDIHFMPAQLGTYAVVQEFDETERYFLGCVLEGKMMDLHIFHEGISELTLSPKMIAGQQAIKVCSECYHIYSIYEPEFCVHCGSIEYTHADINWVNANLKANVPIGCDERYS